MTRENFSLFHFIIFFFFWNNLIVCFLRVSFSSHRWYRIFFRLCKSNIRSFYPYRSIYCEYFSLEILFPIFLSSFFFSISSFIHPRFLIYLFLFRQNFPIQRNPIKIRITSILAEEIFTFRGRSMIIHCTADRYCRMMMYPKAWSNLL